MTNWVDQEYEDATRMRLWQWVEYEGVFEGSLKTSERTKGRFEDTKEGGSYKRELQGLHPAVLKPPHDQLLATIQMLLKH